MSMKVIFRKSNIIFIGLLIFTDSETNNLAIFGSSDAYAIMCYLRSAAVVHGCKNIHLICLMSVAVTYKDCLC